METEDLRYDYVSVAGPNGRISHEVHIVYPPHKAKKLADCTSEKAASDITWGLRLLEQSRKKQHDH